MYGKIITSQFSKEFLMMRRNFYNKNLMFKTLIFVQKFNFFNVIFVFEFLHKNWKLFFNFFQFCAKNLDLDPKLNLIFPIFLPNFWWKNEVWNSMQIIRNPESGFLPISLEDEETGLVVCDTFLDFLSLFLFHGKNDILDGFYSLHKHTSLKITWKKENLCAKVKINKWLKNLLHVVWKSSKMSHCFWICALKIQSLPYPTQIYHEFEFSRQKSKNDFLVQKSI